MLKFLADLVKRFTSRKFLLTLSAALVLVANAQWGELIALIGTYLGFEGGADIVQRYTGNKTAEVQAKLDLAKLDMGLLPDGFEPQLRPGTPPTPSGDSPIAYTAAPDGTPTPLIGGRP